MLYQAYRYYEQKVRPKTSFKIPGLLMVHTLRVFDALEPKMTPFKFGLCVELTLQICKRGACLLSKALCCASVESGNVFCVELITAENQTWYYYYHHLAWL